MFETASTVETTRNLIDLSRWFNKDLASKILAFKGLQLLVFPQNYLGGVFSLQYRSLWGKQISTYKFPIAFEGRI